MRKKIYHFYHIWADGKWEIPLQDNLDYLKSGGLIDNLDEFYVGIVGKEENRLLVKQYLKERSIKHKVCTEKDEGFEQETLDEICNLEDEDAYILYAHTKGSYNDEEYEHRWRKELSKTLIENWEECLYRLQDNFIVGRQYTVENCTSLVHVSICYPPGKIFARYGDFEGNFWWSHLVYLKMLGKPYRIRGKNPFTDSSRHFQNEDSSYLRESAETWLRNMYNVRGVGRRGGSDLKNSQNEQGMFSVYSLKPDYNPGGAKIDFKTQHKSLKDLINSLIHKKEINKSSIITVFLNYEDIYKDPFKLTIEACTKIKKIDGGSYDRVDFRKTFIFKDKTILFELTNLW